MDSPTIRFQSLQTFNLSKPNRGGGQKHALSLRRQGEGGGVPFQLEKPGSLYANNGEIPIGASPQVEDES